MKKIISEIKYNRIYQTHIDLFKDIVVGIDRDVVSYNLCTHREFDDFYELLFHTEAGAVVCSEDDLLKEIFDIDDIDTITYIIIQHLDEYERVDF